MRWLYLPYRFFFILAVTTATGMRYLFSSRSKFPKAAFLKVLFENLGGTYIKAGQALAMRQDFLSVAQLEALSGLLDEVKPFRAEKGLRIVERELGLKLAEAFSEFDPEPVASASFSQVYRARDMEGNAIAVKVKRPRMAQIVFADVAMMRAFGWLASLVGPGRKLGIRHLVEEIVDVLEAELDYLREADYMSIMYESAGDLNDFVVPAVNRKLSTRNILVMDFLEGISLREIFSAIRQGQAEIHDPTGTPIDLKWAGAAIYEITMRSIFELGFFHADPHPGNIFVLPGRRIGFVDYGIVGYLSREARELNFSYVDALARGRMDEAAEIYTQIVVPHKNADFEGLKREMSVQLRVWRAATANPKASFTEKSSGTVLNNSINLARKFHFHLPRNTILYYKTIMTVDHINIELDPGYDSIADAEEFVSEYALRRMQEDFMQTDWMELYRKFSQNLDQATQLIGSIEDFFRERNANQGEQVPFYLKQIYRTVASFSFLGAVAFPILKYGVDRPFFQDFDEVLCWVISGTLVFSAVHFWRMAR